MQIEHLENHIARLTVDVDQERLDKAKQAASRRIASKVNIPGFRKGKAPYAVVARYVGEEAIFEEAIDKLGNEVFHDALVEAQLDPYAPGNLEKIETEPNLKLVFTVAKRPTVSLESYREVRLPFEAPQVEDQAVEDMIERMREAHAVVEAPVERPIEPGDLVKMTLHGTVIHPAHEHEHAHGDEAEAAESEAAPEPEAAEAAPAPETETPPAAEAETAAADAPAAEEHSDENEPEEFIDREVELVMYGDPAKDFVPGFSDQIVGLKAGEEKEFTIAVPDDSPQAQYAGHTYTFKASVLEVKPRILPEMTDEFAKTASEGEVDNVPDLRIAVRKDLRQQAEDEAASNYADKVLAQIIEGAKIDYPEAMVEDYVAAALQDLDNRLRRQGMSLEQLYQFNLKTPEGLSAEYRETAIARLRRDVVVNELLAVEQLRVNDDDVNTRIEEISARFSNDPSQSDSFRKMLERPESRNEIAYDLAMSRLRARIVAIGKGENPPLVADQPSEDAQAETVAAEAPAEASVPSAEAAAPETAAPETPASDDPQAEGGAQA